MRSRAARVLASISLTALLGCAVGIRQPIEPTPRETSTVTEDEAHPGGIVFRAGARGERPRGALMRAREQRDAMLARQAALAEDGQTPAFAGINQNSWELLGPPKAGGRMRSLIIHPLIHDFMLVGAATGGIWRTLSGGQFWSPVDDFMASLTVGCMAIDSIDPQIVYAGTGEGFFDQASGKSNTAPIRGEGIFKSINFGATWFQLAATANADFDFVNRISVGGTGSAVVLAATSTGIHRSTDGGASWTQVYVDPEGVYDVKFKPGDSLFAVASTHHGVPLWSDDNGQSWSVASGFPADDNRIELAWARSSPGKVFGASHGADDSMYVAVSTDSGQSYAVVTVQPPDPDPGTSNNEAGYDAFGSYAKALWVDPTNDSKVIIAGFATYASTNGGISFTRITHGHEDHHVLLEHPAYGQLGNTTVFNGTDGGLFKWDDPFAAALACTQQADGSWNCPSCSDLAGDCENLNEGLVITQFYGADIHPSGAVIGGTQDNGTWVYDPLTQDWIQPRRGDGAYSAIKRADPDTMYFQTQGLVVYRTDDAGQTETGIFNEDGNNPVEPNSNFIAPLELDPAPNSNRLYVAGERLWRTDNPGANPPQWTMAKDSICPPPPPPGHLFAPVACYISAIEVSPQNPGWIWVGHSGGDVWNTTNFGFDWDQRDDGHPLPDKFVSDIVADPHDESVAYVSFMDYSTDNVWKTDDFGATWTPIGAGLPALPVNGLAVHPMLPGHVYAATELGIYASEDDGLTWTAGNVGPSNVSVDELVFMNDKKLMAVTHGRGIWLVDSFDDCNGNMIPDSQDISSGTSNDVNFNTVPDECETGVPPGKIDPTTGGPIRLGKTATGGVSIECPGSCSTGAIAYGVYEGTLGNWYDHTAMPGLCSVSCATGPIAISPSAGDTYYLVVPHNAFAEGSYGTDFTAAQVQNERPRPAAVTERCAEFQMISECP